MAGAKDESALQWLRWQWSGRPGPCWETVGGVLAAGPWYPIRSGPEGTWVSRVLFLGWEFRGLSPGMKATPSSLPLLAE